MRQRLHYVRGFVTETARLSAILVLSVLVASCAGRSTPKTTPDAGGHVDIRELWVEPTDLETRDLFHGPGGPAQAPDPSISYQLIEIDDSGYSPGYDVHDREGIRWSVKLGTEAQPEVVASRILWALGYYQPAVYLLREWRLAGKQPGVQTGHARFRRESPGNKVVADWSWYENPFVEKQPFKGLVIANIMLNNWDWKTSNNKIYENSGDSRLPRRTYVVRDLGASLGKTSYPMLLRWIPLQSIPQGTRNDLEGFEQQGFIKRVEGRRVSLHYRGIHQRLVKTVGVEDVVWTCRLMARLSDSQWRDAFRAAGYSEDDQMRYITKLKSKISEGLALGSTPSDSSATGR